MFKEIVKYELNENIDEQHLLKISAKIIDVWMSKQPGFIRWDIHKDTDGIGYTDILYWKSQEEAKAAEENMPSIPNAVEWFFCFKDGSIRVEGLELIGSFK